MKKANIRKMQYGGTSQFSFQQPFPTSFSQVYSSFHPQRNNEIYPQYKQSYDPYNQFKQDSDNQLKKTGFNVGTSLLKSNSLQEQGLQLIQSAIKLPQSKSYIKPSTVGKSLKDRFSESTFGRNFDFYNALGGAANELFTTTFGEKNEYQGDKGAITQGLDKSYDTIQSVASSFGPIGQMVSLGMSANKLLGNVANKLGGGTDGMCVCAGTKVFTSTGKVINIEDLQKEEGIIGWNEGTKEIKPQAIHNFIEPRQKECVEIVLKNGYFIRCSIDHPILSDTNPKAKSKYINGRRIAVREWKFRRADELKVGDFVGLANNIDYWGNNHLDKAYLVGLLIGDGSYGKGASCRIISADQDTWKYLEDNNLGIINHCDDSRPEKYSKEIRTYRVIGGMELLHQLGISYQTGKNKTLPKNIGTFDKSSVCNLLAGLFDTDGSISVNEEKQTYSITLYQSNIDLLEEVRVQLHKLGIFSTIGTRKAAKHELGGKIINSNESYRLEIHDISSALKFCKLIPLNIFYKKENLGRIYDMLKDKKAQEHNDISGAKQCKIVSITPIGTQIVYNLQADYDHTYLANCIITHNTTTDAILGSAFFQLTPFGLINGFGGKNADTITKNDLAFENVGSSYSGTYQRVNDALQKSGKKYGLFSSGELNDTNQQINSARIQQDIMSNISDEAMDRRAIRNSMAAINGNTRDYKMRGGYKQGIGVGRNGMILQTMDRVKKILNNRSTNKFQQGGQLKENTIATEILLVNPLDVPEFQQGGQVTPKARTLQELIDYAKEVNPRFIQRMSEPLKYVEWDDENGHHFGTHKLGYTEMDGKYFIYPLIQEDSDGNLVRYPQDKWEDARDNAYKNKNGLFFNTKEEAKIFTESQENPDGTFSGYKSGWPDFFKQKPAGKYQNGGSINVIPDGALHARKHNMDMEGITKKGIPVIDNGGEQQAEIEREELIIRLEVTKQLEELEKKFYDNETSQKEKDQCALEAGKLLVKEILSNTKDITNNLL